jgi:hypothetical protein
MPVLRPGLAVHADEVLSGRERETQQEKLEIFVSAIVLDRDSQVCFPKDMVKEAFTKVSRARCRASNDA